MKFLNSILFRKIIIVTGLFLTIPLAIIADNKTGHVYAMMIYVLQFFAIVFAIANIMYLDEQTDGEEK